MKTNKLFTIGVLFLGLIALTGCKKEEGPVGPQGPAGEDGNANVQSEEISVLSSEWEGGGDLYTVNKSSDVITEDIAETGAVLCYLKSGDYFTPLPFSLSAGSWTTHLGFEYTVGEIMFFFQDDDGLTPQPGNRTYKVVAIESRMLETNPEIQDMNYADAMRVLGLDR